MSCVYRITLEEYVLAASRLTYPTRLAARNALLLKDVDSIGPLLTPLKNGSSSRLFLKGVPETTSRTADLKSPFFRTSSFVNSEV